VSLAVFDSDAQRVATLASADDRNASRCHGPLATRETASLSPDCSASLRRAIPICECGAESRVQSVSLDAVSVIVNRVAQVGQRGNPLREPQPSKGTRSDAPRQSGLRARYLGAES
jgi:hypothetical protein